MTILKPPVSAILPPNVIPLVFPGVTPAYPGLIITPSVNIPTLTPFNPTLTISTDNPVIGHRLPMVDRDPFLSQPAVAYGFGNSLFPAVIGSGSHAAGVTNIVKREIARRFAATFECIQRNDLDAAGAGFKEIRELCSRMPPHARGESDGIFTMATFGEALYGEVSDETFAALQTVRHMAKSIKGTQEGEELIAREMLMRAVAHSRLGDDEIALLVLDRFKDREPVKQQKPLRTLGLIMYANLLVNRAVTHVGEPRNDALHTLYQVMTEDLKASIDTMPDASEQAQKTANALAQFYVFIADFFLQQHYPESAVDIANQARRMFPVASAIEDLFSTDDSPDVDLAAATPLRQLLQKVERSKGKIGIDNFLAGATEFLSAASLPSNKLYWIYATLGSLAGAIGNGILGDGSISGIMMGSAIAATGAVAARKAYSGFTAQEPRQAFSTGHTDRSLLNVATKEAAKLLGTYAAFGGALPFLGVLPDALLASHDGMMGQVHGLGSIVAGLSSSGIHHVSDLINAIGLHGFTDGIPSWWHDWVAVSPFAEAVNNGLTLPFSDDPWGKIFSKWDLARIPEWMKLSADTPADVVRSMILGSAYAYMGVSGAYALSTVVPQAKDWVHKNIVDERFARYLLPGAWAATSAAMVASGFAPFDAAVFTGICYLVQYRHHVQSGGDWNLLKKDARDAVDCAKMMFAGAIQLLYIGPGNAIRPTLTMVPKPAHWDFANEVAPYIMDNIYAHFGMIPFLAALGIVHAYLTGLSIPQTLKAKFAKGPTYEAVSNPLKLMLGWTSLWGNVASTIIKEFGLGAIVSQSFREAGGSPVQHRNFRKMLEGVAKTSGRPVPSEMATDAVKDIADTVQSMKERADNLYRAGKEEAAKGSVYEHQRAAFLKLPLPDQLLALADAYFVPQSERALFSLAEHPDWSRTIVYRALVDPQVPRETVDEYLDRLTAVAYDISPDQYDARRYLLIATMGASAGSAHGETIKRYFTEGSGRSFVRVYDLDIPFKEMNGMAPTKGRKAWWGMGARRWMRWHLKPTPERAFYDAAAMAGRKYAFSAPLTGRSLIENGAFLTSFIMAAAKDDPAFQTDADPTFYRDTLYEFLMTPAKKAKTTTKDYETHVILPALRAIGEAAKQLGDNRKDVRHNLLTTVWLAQLGPHREILQPWIDEHKHLFHANGVSAKFAIKGKDHGLEFPTGLGQGRLINRLFAKYLWDSQNSADGQVVYPAAYWRSLNWRAL